MEFGLLTFFLPQFVCVESLVTAIVDLFPEVFRKKGRRELLILGIAVICYLIGLLLVTEVRSGGQWEEEIQLQNICYYCNISNYPPTFQPI